VYGPLIGYPELKPHDLRHGVAMEVYTEHRDLEQVRALLGHVRIETTQVYAQIQPAQLKQSVSFYEARALERDAIELAEFKYATSLHADPMF
jgi:site-specific recombinase XerC